jgi:prolyl-tRNA synthetase
MLVSKLFTKTRKEAPKDEVAKNAMLLIRAGYIDKLHAGVYSYLPLGLRVISNIKRVICEEMNNIGGQEILLPALHPKDIWEKTGRWDSMDDLYKLKDSQSKEFALGATHEEVIAPLLSQFIDSYKDLPKYVYQIQNKFRMELRAKSGLLRGKEFLMKDLYSFHADENDLDDFYAVVADAYRKIFERLGISSKTYYTYAAGGTFSKYSHEFQTITPAGEDIIHVCNKCNIAVNDEVKNDYPECPECRGVFGPEQKSIEIGNIFKLGTKFSVAGGLRYKNSSGESLPVVMGSYGIGVGRLMGSIVEVTSDEAGLAWPEEIAPFKYHLIALPDESGDVLKFANEAYKTITEHGKNVLFDDRLVSAGEKFADADLIGIPKRLVVSHKTIEKKEIEFKDRKKGETALISLSELLK